MTIVSEDEDLNGIVPRIRKTDESIFCRLRKSLTYSMIQLFWRLMMRNTLSSKKGSEA